MIKLTLNFNFFIQAYSPLPQLEVCDIPLPIDLNNPAVTGVLLDHYGKQ
jgi:hypothetical protein